MAHDAERELGLDTTLGELARQLGAGLVLGLDEALASREKALAGTLARVVRDLVPAVVTGRAPRAPGGPGPAPVEAATLRDRVAAARGPALVALAVAGGGALAAVALARRRRRR
jgi:hypothetical protein